MKNSIMVQGITPEQFSKLLTEDLKGHIEKMIKDLNSKKANDYLLSRQQACDFLKINSSTLNRWTKEGKIPVHGIKYRRYYKRGELLNALTQLKQ